MDVRYFEITELQAQTLIDHQVELSMVFYPFLPMDKTHAHVIVVRHALHLSAQEQSLQMWQLAHFLSAKYLDCSEQTIVLGRLDSGKPYIQSNNNKMLHLSMSHTAGFYACAFALNRAIGIDIESLHRLVRAESLAARYFSPQEAAIIAGANLHEQKLIFFRYWTLKEAVIKAQGLSLLSYPLSHWQFLLGPWVLQHAICTMTHPLDIQMDLLWQMQHREYVLSLAVLAATA